MKLRLAIFLALLIPTGAAAQGVGDFGAWIPVNPSPSDQPARAPAAAPPGQPAAPITKPAPVDRTLKSPAAPGDVPRAEFYGGYSYVSIDTNGISSRQSASGWQLATNVNVTKMLGAEFGVSGYYKSYGPVSVRDFSFVGGPRFTFRPVFLHALAGWDDLTGSVSGVPFSASQSGFAAAFGGGAEFPVSRWIAIRGSADYFLTRHGGSERLTQNNFRLGAGIVFRFGSLGSTAGK